MLIRALQAAAGNFGVTGYAIEDSLRFNDNDSAYLSRTPSVAGNRKTWTWSGWVKRGNLVSAWLFDAGTTVDNRTSLYFNAGGNLLFQQVSGGSNYHVRVSTASFNDTSGWYHVVFVADTANAIAEDRVKIWVNGVRLTSWSLVINGAVNFDTFINNNQLHRIGSYAATIATLYDGYLAEINFIDGQALTPNSFGQIDATTGEWSPKKYAGTYGTNGFYLPFDGNANDDSGNGNNWTENNLASTDYMIDTPSTNFSVFNVLSMGSTFSNVQEGNLEFYRSSATPTASAGTMAVSSGKYYYEIYLVSRGSTGASFGVGIQDSSLPLSVLNGYCYYFLNGQFLTFGAGSAYGSTLVAGDILGVAYDLDAGTLTFYKNGVSLGVAISSLPSASYIPLFIDGGGNNASQYSSTQVLNFGQDSSFAGRKTRQGNTDANGVGDFYYTPPAGYLALCTDNLPAPAIKQPETQFNVVTYTGNGGTLDVDVGFQPDFVWTKSRTNAYVHGLWDTVRGVGKHLMSNLTNAEVTNDPDGYLSAFNPNGFTLSAGSSSSATWNLSGGTYVAWCWKAGGTAVTNTDGAITSQVSANVDAGFSIVSYTGTGANATVGHGLSSAPAIVIVKNRNGVVSGGTWWLVYTTAIDGSPDYLRLDSTDASGTSGEPVPTSTVFSIAGGTLAGASGAEYIAYCFHSVEGFSKIGSYVGNGSADGPFVYTGFKPAFVMVKRTDASNASTSWEIIDNERSGYNTKNDLLYADIANAEYSGATYPDWNILSNGFKVMTSRQNVNVSGGTYIYMAFAEHPFNYATGR